MPTTIGMERDLPQMLERLMVLDFDAIEAYRCAADSCRSEDTAQALLAFAADHERHTRELASIVEPLGGRPPQQARLTALFSRGKVSAAAPFGDDAILGAMLANEFDTNIAYDLVLQHEEMPAQARPLLTRGLEDERYHRDWISGRLMPRLFGRLVERASI